MPAPFDSAFIAIAVGLPYAIVIARFLQVRGSSPRLRPAPVRGAVPFRTVQRRVPTQLAIGRSGEPIAASRSSRRRVAGPIAMRVAARQSEPVQQSA